MGRKISLCESNVVGLRSRFGPLFPSSSLDIVTQVRGLENNTSKASPWTTKVVVFSFDGVVQVCNIRVADNEPGVDIGALTSRGGNGSVGNGSDIVVLEPCIGSFAEDEVDSTDN